MPHLASSRLVRKRYLATQDGDSSGDAAEQFGDCGRPGPCRYSSGFSLKTSLTPGRCHHQQLTLSRFGTASIPKLQGRGLLR
ncbi:hypothetical protein ACRRTK_006175 [Alexandromys fortis]